MLLDDLGNLFTFQTFDDSKNKKGNLVSTMHGSLADCRDSLELLNSQGAGVFFTVNQTDSRGRDASNITRIRALFIDLDDPNPNRKFNYFLHPSAVIESSPGKHQVYWFLHDDLPLNEFRAYQKALIAAFGSDPKIHDLPRVMRVPGFMHCKGEPFLVRQIIDTGLTYSHLEIKDWLSVEPEREPVKAEQPREKVVYRGDDPDAKVIFGNLLVDLEMAVEGTRNNTLNKVAFAAYGLVKAGRLYKDDVYAALIDVSLAIGLSESEAETTIRSAKNKSVPVFNDLDLLPAQTEDDHSDGVQIIDASREPFEPPEWLWHEWIAKKAIHILAGAPSTGKTTVCLKLAAQISRGGTWPDGTPCQRQNVAIWSGEDDRRTTLIPRLLKAGADLNYIKFVGDVSQGKDVRSFDPAKDMKGLAAKLKKLGNVGLFIIDPIVSAVAGDGHKNNEVRRSLQPIHDLASSVGCAVIGITHMTKGTQGRDPIERIVGSIAFGALARVVYIAVKNIDENNDVTRLFLRAKSNLGPDNGGFNYSLQVGPLPDHPGFSTTHVEWGDWIDGYARDILNDSEKTTEEKVDIDDAKAFLQEYLADGPRDVKSINAAARQAGVLSGTLRRAKTLLRVKSVKADFGSGWEWSI